ncbi:uncharacterized protein HHUB_3588 [Halobacterium hubeiense]|jgi:hypothetical protein|uniref:Uncharacterized protein n=1 Tax=Halobacterium hubeiense TaxID=1407499 RepID=A0A0U5HXB6_9EURY|nr:hypothetical protein [Halobacterium hubeiense]CQH61916.1 uncharacterized protein HHUB_3588 [Halobacterium hubeiense]
MRQLDTCDFCADAANGVYEVVPASVAGESRRLALCADCRATLQSVVDPLLDAAGTPAAAPEAESKSETEPESESESDRRDDADADASPSVDSAAESGDDEDGIVIESGSRDEQEGGNAENADSGKPERRPSGYGQVIRLLQNRDGAMPRDDLRALATNAYNLGGREFEDAVEAAVENGDVEESPDGLRTT